MKQDHHFEHNQPIKFPRELACVAGVLPMGSFSEDSSEKKLIIGIWAGVSSNDALSSPTRTKRLLRRLHVNKWNIGIG
jgi:hypothetical protein